MLTAEFDKLSADTQQTQQTHQSEKTKLLDKRKKLLEAHFAGAIPLDLLKEQPDHIARRLAWLDTQLAVSQEVFDNANAHLDDVLLLCGYTHALYMSLDDNLRRVCNQAFFEKIRITDADTVTGAPHNGFSTVLHPGVQQAAINASLPGDAPDLASFESTVAGLNITGRTVFLTAGAARYARWASLATPGQRLVNTQSLVSSAQASLALLPHSIV